jgi:hypothetical protein
MQNGRIKVMKKLLTAALVFVLLATPASAGPLAPIISIYGLEDFLMIRQATEDSNEEDEFIYLPFPYHNAHKVLNREDFLYFLNLLDSLPIPLPFEKKYTFSSLGYDYEYNIFRSITFFCDDRGFYSFSIIESSFFEIQEEEQIFLYKTEDGNVIIYDFSENFDSIYSVLLNFYFYGYYIFGYYHDENNNTSNFCIEQFAESLVLGSINDLIPVFTTSDALTVLRATAGLLELTDGQSARLGIDGAPASADALRILRIIAGVQ